MIQFSENYHLMIELVWKLEVVLSKENIELFDETYSSNIF